MNKTSDKLRIRILETRDVPATIECVLDTYERDNVIARSLGITREDFRPTAEESCQNAAKNGLGVILADDDDVKGFVLSSDFSDAFASSQARANSSDERMAAWGYLLTQCEREYIKLEQSLSLADSQSIDNKDDTALVENIAPGKVLYLDIIGLHPDVQNQHWTLLLGLVSAYEFGFLRGYQSAAAIGTHPNAQKTMHHAPSRFITEVPFKNMSLPLLKAITSPKSVIVASIDLNPGLREKIHEAMKGLLHEIVPHRVWERIPTKI